MRSWRSKLLESLVTENMKAKIVNATPKFQIGGMPKSQSCENLLILKNLLFMLHPKNYYYNPRIIYFILLIFL